MRRKSWKKKPRWIRYKKYHKNYAKNLKPQRQPYEEYMLFRRKLLTTTRFMLRNAIFKIPLCYLVLLGSSLYFFNQANGELNFFLINMSSFFSLFLPEAAFDVLTERQVAAVEKFNQHPFSSYYKAVKYYFNAKFWTLTFYLVEKWGVPLVYSKIIVVIIFIIILIITILLIIKFVWWRIVLWKNLIIIATVKPLLGEKYLIMKERIERTEGLKDYFRLKLREIRNYYFGLIGKDPVLPNEAESRIKLRKFTRHFKNKKFYPTDVAKSYSPFRTGARVSYLEHVERNRRIYFKYKIFLPIFCLFDILTIFLLVLLLIVAFLNYCKMIYLIDHVEASLFSLDNFENNCVYYFQKPNFFSWYKKNKGWYDHWQVYKETILLDKTKNFLKPLIKRLDLEDNLTLIANFFIFFCLSLFFLYLILILIFYIIFVKFVVDYFYVRIPPGEELPFIADRLRLNKIMTNKFFKKHIKLTKEKIENLEKEKKNEN